MVLKEDREERKKLEAALKKRSEHPTAARLLEKVKHSQIVRVLFIIRDLDRTGGIDRYELASKYDVSEKTIQRDLETLQAVGLPIVEEEGKGQRKLWRIAFRDKLQEIASLFDISHYFAMIFSLRQGSALRGTPIFTDAEDLCDKLADFLGDKEQAQLKELDNCFYSHESHAYKAAPIDSIWPLAMAITKKRICTVTYQKEGSSEVKTYNVLPLKLMVHTGAVYLVHQFEGSKTLGKLKLNRFRDDVKIHERTAERPTPQAIEAYLTRGFGLSPGGRMTLYKLLFRADKRDAVHERIWHHTQTITDLPDGSVELTFEVGESHEVTAWICSWRDGVVVLGPLAEVERVFDFCEWGFKRYLSMVSPERRAKATTRALQISPKRPRPYEKKPHYKSKL